MQLREICTCPVVTCGRDTSALELAQLMRDRHVGDVVIVEQHEDGATPVGIVTDRDLVIEVMARGVAPELLCAGDLIGDGIVTVLESEAVYDAIWQMRSKGIRRLPVVDAQGLLLGILTADDVTRFIAEELTELARVAPRQIKHEMAAREPVAH
ncbi:MAG TPA: CBS domain-containing protein [Albitalea sp.]